MNSDGKKEQATYWNSVPQTTRQLIVEIFRDVWLDVGSAEQPDQPNPELHTVMKKDLTPLQEGRLFHDLTQEINPATGKKWKYAEIARHLNVPYHRVRNRHAVTMPFKAH